MTVFREVRLARSPGDLDFSDLTSAQVVGEASWSPDEPDALVLPFDRKLSKSEARSIRRRLVTASPDEEARVTSYADARAALADAEASGPLATVLTAVAHLLDDKLAQYGE